MGITKERRLLQMIHQHARIEKSCRECVHEGDYTVCSKCDDRKHKLWEWKWETEYWRLRAIAETTNGGVNYAGKEDNKRRTL